MRLALVALMTLAVLTAVGLIARHALFGRSPVTPTNPPSSAVGLSPTLPRHTTLPRTTTTTFAAGVTTTRATTTQPPAPTTHEPTADPTPPATQSQPAGSSYDAYNNSSMGWWFRHVEAADYGKDIPTTIDGGVAALLARYNGIWQQDTAEKVIYLTMDEGYEYLDNTTRILDIAANKGVKINFFITGDYITRATDLVLRMHAEGHLICSHTWSHPHQAELLASDGVAAVVEDVQRLERAYQDLTGEAIAPFLRPPQGAYSERSLKVLQDIGYRAVFWSFAYRDWITTEQPNPAESLAQIVGELHPGAVYLLHAVSTTNVSILPDLIDTAHARGYRFALLNEFPAG